MTLKMDPEMGEAEIRARREVMKNELGALFEKWGKEQTPSTLAAFLLAEAYGHAEGILFKQIEEDHPDGALSIWVSLSDDLESARRARRRSMASFQEAEGLC